MNRIFALTTRGLEQISAREMASLPGVTVDTIGYRRIHARCRGNLAPLLALSTVDDVFVDVATWRGIGHTRDTLVMLQTLSAELELHAAVAACAQVRTVDAQPSFSVTANFVGKRNYTTDEIKQALAAGIALSHGWRYEPNDADAVLNVRIFIEHETAFLGVRLGAVPLHRRPYKQAQQPGSLKPTVAAAMLVLLETGPGQTLLDPCCGAGTILIEAARKGAVVQGGDIDAAAVAAARANAEHAGVAATIRRWDARALPLPNAAVDRIASNLPWDRQVSVDAGLAELYGQICQELERVLAPQGRVALLTNTPELLVFDKLSRGEQIEISLFGQTPSIVIFQA